MKILVLTSVFPNEAQPNLGIFVRERMFKVAKHCEMKVVAPVSWFPFINLIKKNYRPLVAYQEKQHGIEVYHPKFFNFPFFFKFLDGFFFFMSSVRTVWHVRRTFDFDVIDAHFAYPCGFGAVLMGKLFSRPVTVTVRGNERIYLQQTLIRHLVRYTLRKAGRVFSVCRELKELVERTCGSDVNPIVVGNGVDLVKFKPIEKNVARNLVGLPPDKQILLSAGWITKWKGFHRIIDAMPTLLERFPGLLLVIVGGSPVTDSYEEVLREMIHDRGLEQNVLLVGPKPHEEMYKWMSAADVFCLATQGEGWANVFLEAMACGSPVVATRVGGNPEVVSDEDVGILFDLENEKQMVDAITESLCRRWDVQKILTYARGNTWSSRVDQLLQEFQALADDNRGTFNP